MFTVHKFCHIIHQEITSCGCFFRVLLRFEFKVGHSIWKITFCSLIKFDRLTFFWYLLFKYFQNRPINVKFSAAISESSKFEMPDLNLSYKRESICFSVSAPLYIQSSAYRPVCRCVKIWLLNFFHGASKLFYFPKITMLEGKYSLWEKLF